MLNYFFGNVLLRHSIDLGSRSWVAVGLSLVPLFSDLPQIKTTLLQIMTALPQIETALQQIETALPQIETTLP